MPARRDLSSILVIGSGPIVIGQACEFDYSGTQACRVLKEEGYRVILANSNPATIMTDPATADATYVEPLDADVLMWFAPASVPDAGFPGDKVRAFLVPKGTMVVIKPGTWHHGPFCLGSEPANILVALPERTYANDTRTIVLEGDDCLLIASPPNP